VTEWMYWLGVATVAAPFAMTVGLGGALLLGLRLSEVFTHRLLQAGVTAGLVSAAGVFALMLATGERDAVINLGEWVHVPPHYHFHIELLFDRLSVPFAILSLVLCGTVGAFATRYMHREPGYQRFFFLFALFTLGMATAAVAGSVETLFAGWELVGLSSVLLIGFFHDRPAPVRNGFRVWVVYRAADAALLLAVILAHGLVKEGDFHKLLGPGEWPYQAAPLTAVQAGLIGGLLLFAAAGKSALLPFCGWLPRAMEGPTPSSAVFYGALSVHLGAFLLLRVSPLIALSTPLAVAVVALGAGTAAFAHAVGRVQTDIKSVLSFASLTQVGIIVAEIGAGHWLPFLWWVALVHLIGHACLRTLQFVRAPSLLLDYKAVENAIGAKLPRPDAGPPSRLSLWAYRFALERGYLDAVLSDYVARPFVLLFRTLTRWERAWTDRLNGTGGGPAAEPVEPTPSPAHPPLAEAGR
jgi:NADH-quinone oxidoreductase subunit L